MMRVALLYFAGLRDAAGVERESIETPATTLRELYENARAKHGFSLPAERLRVAVDGAFAAWEDCVREDAEIAFIPPVSGG